MSRRRRPPSRPDDAPPRSEAAWEAEFRRSDAVADRYGELLETLLDDPDRDEKIDREMGWDGGDAKGDGEGEVERAIVRAKASIDRLLAVRAEAGDDVFEVGDADAEDRADRAAVPAYAAAADLGHRVVRLLKDWRPAAGSAGGAGAESADELVGRAFIGIHIATAKLLSGHGMGYDDEGLCGVIVLCRRALAAAADGRAAWELLAAHGCVPADVAADIVAGHAQTCRLIEERIAELRLRVWW